jgi:alpha-tubulin suppressor-like RCC1 family protein
MRALIAGTSVQNVNCIRMHGLLFFAAGALVCQSYGGTVVAWGKNGQGQTNVPTDLTNVIAIAAGSQHSLALKADGGVVGWGSKASALSVVPAGLTNVISIVAGGSNTMALKADGTVTVWGTNNFGPVYVPGGLTNVVGIAGGFMDSLILRPDGSLFAWGRQAGLALVQSNIVATSPPASRTGWRCALTGPSTLGATTASANAISLRT